MSKFPHHANFVFNILGKKDDLKDINKKSDCSTTVKYSRSVTLYSQVSTGHEEYGLVDQEAMLKPVLR